MSKGLRILVLFCFAGILSACSPRLGPDSFFFVQMADTQFGFFNDNRDFKKETVNFEKAVAAANRLKPQFVVVCGDLVNTPGDMGQIAEYKRIAARLDPAIRLYNVAGNHDVENFPTPESLTAYRKNFGSDYYTFAAGSILGIVLNSSLMRDPDSARMEAIEQDRWLQGELAKARRSKDKIIMVFQHHSLFLNNPDEKDEYFNFPEARRKKYLALFKEHDVRFVFAGHYHRNAGGHDGELEMITTGPVGRPLGLDPSGFRIITVDQGIVKHKYYGLDNIPGIDQSQVGHDKSEKQ